MRTVVLSNADTIRDGDELTTLLVTLRVTVNRTEYSRAIADVRTNEYIEDIEGELLTRIERGDGFLPPNIVHDVEVD